MSSSVAGGEAGPSGTDPRWVVRLADALRDAGIGVGTGQVIACHRAVTVGAHAYWAARTTLVVDRDDLSTFDAVYRRHRHGSRLPPPAGTVEPTGSTEASVDRQGGAGGRRETTTGGHASSRERLRNRRFADATPDELAEIERLLDGIAASVPSRLSRRRRAGRGEELDLPRTLERSLATDGELIDRAWTARRRVPRRLVLVIDVSGSMAGYARAMMRLAVAVRRAGGARRRPGVEVFAFGTRLTRLTGALDTPDVDRAVTTAARRVVDWDGGTRIGESIAELVRVWGPRGVLRSAVVVICSDGLERGDPRSLEGALSRLSRHAHRIVWVNPLVGGRGYVPVQRGMAAALPHVDVLHPGHDLASLESLVDTLGSLR